MITQQHSYSLKSNLIWVEFLRSYYHNFDLWLKLGTLEYVEPDLTPCGFVCTTDM